MDSALNRLAPLTGTLFALLTLVGFIAFGGDTPDGDASAAKVVSYYTAHHGAQTTAVLFVAFGALALIFFAGTLRAAFDGPEPGSERRASIVFGGALIAAAGLLGMASAHFAVADFARKVTPEAAQALNAVDGSAFIVMIGGMAALLISAGLVAITTRRVLPVWMGWAGLVLGILCATPVGWLASALGMLWVGAVGLVLWRRAARQAPLEAAAPAPALG